MTEPRQIPREEIMSGLAKALYQEIEKMEGRDGDFFNLIDIVDCLVTLAGDCIYEFIPNDHRVLVFVDAITLLCRQAGVDPKEVRKMASSMPSPSDGVH